MGQERSDLLKVTRVCRLCKTCWHLSAFQKIMLWLCAGFWTMLTTTEGSLSNVLSNLNLTVELSAPRSDVPQVSTKPKIKIGAHHGLRRFEATVGRGAPRRGT